MPKNFQIEEILPSMLEQIVRVQLFKQNGVEIEVRVRVATNEITYVVSHIENGEKAFRVFYHIEQAMDHAEDVQGGK